MSLNPNQKTFNSKLSLDRGFFFFKTFCFCRPSYMLNITATVDLPYTACQPFSTSNIQQSQRGAAQSGCQPP